MQWGYVNAFLPLHARRRHLPVLKTPHRSVAMGIASHGHRTLPAMTKTPAGRAPSLAPSGMPTTRPVPGAMAAGGHAPASIVWLPLDGARELRQAATGYGCAGGVLRAAALADGASRLADGSTPANFLSRFPIDAYWMRHACSL